MNNIIDKLTDLANLMQENMYLVLTMLLALWLFNFVNFLLGYRLNYLGIYPRTFHGLIGIVFAPFLHGNFNHLFFNSFPLFFLVNFVLVGGEATFYRVSLIIIVLSGLGIWLFGRKAIHVGASSLVMGYWSYLLVNAYYEPTVFTIALGVISVYYFGGLFLMLVPSEEGVSWEGHLFGFLAGIAAAFI